jgi:hypothetical protein
LAAFDRDLFAFPSIRTHLHFAASFALSNLINKHTAIPSLHYNRRLISPNQPKNQFVVIGDVCFGFEMNRLYPLTSFIRLLPP